MFFYAACCKGSRDEAYVVSLVLHFSGDYTKYPVGMRKCVTTTERIFRQVSGDAFSA